MARRRRTASRADDSPLATRFAPTVKQTQALRESGATFAALRTHRGKGQSYQSLKSHPRCTPRATFHFWVKQEQSSFFLAGGAGYYRSISGREEKLRVLSSKPDGYVSTITCTSASMMRTKAVWSHRTETRVGGGRECRGHGPRSWAILAASALMRREVRECNPGSGCGPDWRRHDPRYQHQHDIKHVVSVP